MRVLDLFSGIGGFSLGLERAGMKTVAFCEIDPFCRKVLRKHWPNVPIAEDIKKLWYYKHCQTLWYGEPNELSDEVYGGPIDVICGGFPCQDISNAGKRSGIEGERSGLWSEYARLIGEIRPQYAIVENVAALLGRGLDRVLGDLAALGYDAEWHCIPASAVGAPHRRDRIWIVAYPRGAGRGEGVLRQQGNDGQQVNEGWAVEFAESSEAPALVADSLLARLERQRTISVRIGEKLNHSSDVSWWRTEPNVGRVANGVPSRVDRLRGLGNAVVPQIPEIIGRAILQCESGRLG